MVEIRTICEATSNPPSVVTSSRFSGTRQTVFGFTNKANSSMLSEHAISMLSGT